MTTERARTVKGLVEEHSRRRKAARNPRKPRPLMAQIPSMNPVARWYKDRGINTADVQQGFDTSGANRGRV